jgi:hypothetical protein
MTSFAARGSGGNLTEMSDDLLVQQVEAENAAVLGITGAPIDRMTWKYPRAAAVQRWSRAASERNSRSSSHVAGSFPCR